MFLIALHKTGLTLAKYSETVKYPLPVAHVLVFKRRIRKYFKKLDTSFYPSTTARWLFIHFRWCACNNLPHIQHIKATITQKDKGSLKTERQTTLVVRGRKKTLIRTKQRHEPTMNGKLSLQLQQAEEPQAVLTMGEKTKFSSYRKWTAASPHLRSHDEAENLLIVCEGFKNALFDVSD